MSKKYTDAEKAEYWKSQALAKQKRPYVNKSVNYKAVKSKARKSNYQKSRGLKESGSPGWISSAGGGLGALAGEAVGGPIGSMAGGWIGSKLGHLAEKITGFGDYKVQSNSLMRGGLSQAQIANSSKKGGTIIRHREYLGDIVATEDFTIQKYPLNPGQSSTFPWLSEIGNNYEQYRFRGMIFEYNSTSSDAVLSSSASSGLGSVIMATEYDSINPPFPNKRTMLNHQFACSTKPSCGAIHPVECLISQTPTRLQYVRGTVGFPAGGDPRLYDLGSFYLATEGMQNASSTSVIGELYVIYEVEFFKPQISSVPDLAQTDFFQLTPVSSGWLTGAVPYTSNNIGGTCQPTYYQFPASAPLTSYFCTFIAAGGGSVTTPSMQPVSLVNCVLTDVWPGGTLYTQAPGAGIAGNSIMCQFVITVTASNARFGFPASVVPTTSPNGVLTVTAFTNDLVPLP